MAKKKTRHYPTVRGSSIAQVAAVAPADFLIQIDKCLARLNRRLYRQGRYYEVKIDIDPTATNNFEVYALRDDWAVQKAFQMAYQVYLDNTHEEREALGSKQIARWSDFRVGAGLSGVGETFPVLHQPGGLNIPINAGEFELAQVGDQNGTLRAFTWGPTDAITYGLLEEYDKAANASNEPSSTTGDVPYAGVDILMDANVASELQTDGNAPPYDADGLNTDEPWVKIAELGTGATGAQKLSTGFFTAPCGLVLIRGVTPTTENIQFISWSAKRGDYKGVHAPSIVEVETINRKRKVVK